MGAKDAAKKQMSKLEDRLQEMRDQNGTGNQSQDVKEAQQIMEDMKSLQKNQADLLNKTFDNARQEETRAQQRQQQNARRQRRVRRPADSPGHRVHGEPRAANPRGDSNTGERPQPPDPGARLSQAA